MKKHLEKLLTVIISWWRIRRGKFRRPDIREVKRNQRWWPYGSSILSIFQAMNEPCSNLYRWHKLCCLLPEHSHHQSNCFDPPNSKPSSSFPSHFSHCLTLSLNQGTCNNSIKATLSTETKGWENATKWQQLVKKDYKALINQLNIWGKWGALKPGPPHMLSKTSLQVFAWLHVITAPNIR